MSQELLNLLHFIFRWGHVLFGIVWIGMLYYFNFVQTEYFKEAEAQAKADAVKKLAPRALWWFRWGAMFTFLSGLVLIYFIGAHHSIDQHLIWIGATAGILMFLNVWLIIWPNQKVVIGIKSGDSATAAAKAGLASRTNTLLSGPMLFGMLGNGSIAPPVLNSEVSDLGFFICLALIALAEANALFGKTGPLTSVAGVIHCSIALTAAFWLILAFV